MSDTEESNGLLSIGVVTYLAILINMPCPCSSITGQTTCALKKIDWMTMYPVSLACKGRGKSGHRYLNIQTEYLVVELEALFMDRLKESIMWRNSY
jgi:hypothetical protein